MNSKILKAFFHRGRKKFVPWLAEEIARKLDMDVDDVNTGLRSLAAESLAKSRKAEGHGTRPTWELTTLGKAEAENMLRAEEIVRAK